MFKEVRRRAIAGLMALALIMTNVVLPVTPAFAAGPPGNNGTVKINDEAAEEDPGLGNEPHLTSCTVWVRWYGFDEGLRASTVTFEAHGSTNSNQLVSPVGPQNTSFVAPTPETGNTLSYEKSFVLQFTGAPAADGYHVKTTVYTDGSLGNDTKSKVFWVPASCGTKTAVPVAPTVTPITMCGMKGSIVFAETEGIVYTLTKGNGKQGEYEVTATALQGYEIAEGAQTVFTGDLGEYVKCPHRIATPKVKVKGICGIDNDKLIIAKSKIYIVSKSEWENGVRYVTFTIKDGVNKVFAENGEKSITVEVDEKNTELCPQDEVVTPDAPVIYDYCYTDQDYLWIPYTTGIIYKVNGVPASGESVLYQGEELVVTAEAEKGYKIAEDAQTEWTFGASDFSDEQCLTITKSVKSVEDTNGDGKTSIGDTITWEITVTNNSATGVDLDQAFQIQVEDLGVTLEDDGYIGYLNSGESKTLLATSVITLEQAAVCEAVNTATFSAWRLTLASPAEQYSSLMMSENYIKPLATGSAFDKYTWQCTPGQGGNTPDPETPETPVVVVLPNTSAGMPTQIIMAGVVVVMSVITLAGLEVRSRLSA